MAVQYITLVKKKKMEVKEFNRVRFCVFVEKFAK